MPTGRLSPETGSHCNIESTIDPTRFKNKPELIDFFGYLWALDSAKTIGYVWPSNAHLMERFDVVDRTLERWLKRLQALGAVLIKQIDGIERRIYLLVSKAELLALLSGERLRQAVARVTHRVGSLVGGDVEGHSLKSRNAENDNTRKPKAIPKPEQVVVPPPSVPETTTPDPETVRQAQEAVAQYAQRHPIRCMAALLRTAIAQRWKPAFPAEKVERSVRYVTAPREFVQRWEEERQRLQREHEARRQQAQRETPALANAPTDAQEPESGAIEPSGADCRGLARIAAICQRRASGA